MAASIFNNVDGCHLDMEEFHSHIAFETPSDALFASIHFKYKDTLPMTIFDDFLSLFRQTDFNSKHVTFQQTEDIFDRIADQRQAIMMERNAKHSTERNLSTATGNPRVQRLVPELLAEYYDTIGRSPFQRTIGLDYSRYGEDFNANRSLADMALVHRSWADIAQRYLRRRFYIRDQATLRSVLQSPLLCPKIRELSFCGMSWKLSSIAGGNKIYIRKTEMSRLLCKVLTRCCNLTHLYLKYYDLNDGDDRAPGPHDRRTSDVIGLISNLKCLEHLWLRRVSDLKADREDLERICTAISGLRSLKSLQLRGWKVPDEKYRTNTNVAIECKKTLDVTVTTGPPATLDSVSLVSVNITTSGLLSWLMNPSNGNRITRLELSLGDMIRSHNRQVVISSSIQQFLANGMTAHITILQIFDYMEHDCFGSIISNFPTLHSLSLYVRNGFGLPTNPIVLPKSTQELRVHFHDVPRQDQDASALAVIKANPNMRRMLLSLWEWAYYEGDCDKLPPGLLCNDTLTYIVSEKKDDDMCFKVYKVEDEPHFLDL